MAPSRRVNHQFENLVLSVSFGLPPVLAGSGSWGMAEMLRLAS